MKLKTNFSLRADTYASKSAIAFHFCFVHSLLIVWLYGRLKKIHFSLVWGSFKCLVRLFKDVKSQQVSVICCLFEDVVV